jgi:hypothetical protein
VAVEVDNQLFLWVFSRGRGFGAPREAFQQNVNIRK